MTSTSLLDRPDRIHKLDPSGMAELLRDFPSQVEDAIRIGEDFRPPRSLLQGSIEKVIFTGLGGSAIGGDVIRSLTALDCPVPIWVSRHYKLPPFADSRTLCIFSSYSGNTEETLSAFREGIRRKLKALVITSGGELACMCGRASIPWIELPKGFPPRLALGYSVFPILKLFSRLGLWKWEGRAVEETLSILSSLARKKYSSEVPFRINPAKKLAQSLAGRWVVIYAGTELLDSAALRFRNQIEENAKAMASHHLLPEMNHNEILGWRFPANLLPRCACVFLRDRGDHSRIQLRMKITKNWIAKKRGVFMSEFHSSGKSRLARLFSVIHLGDWASYYLALLYRIDPTPVAVIESLKKQLARVKF